MLIELDSIKAHMKAGPVNRLSGSHNCLNAGRASELNSKKFLRPILTLDLQIKMVPDMNQIDSEENNKQGPQEFFYFPRKDINFLERNCCKRGKTN